ncbi:RNA-binding protein 47 isoform 2-like [Tropilaelaps mercedesae]|uniref:RNA-binding protein 47 isoform 2-like n=1 Tax=Tropilaelaps mercedesae TaxID=418985 RepID=A0A1V9XJJ2_9ACAR|nr:RNA-binding protein 47 isoform 2-like [Tropilaelaps mercedesae]
MIDYRGQNKGFGFVTYADSDTAQRAVQELDKAYLRPHKRIAAVLSVDNRRLFLGGVPPSANAEDILSEVTARVRNVTDVILYSSADDPAKNRGYAFIEFQDHMSAAIARKEFQQNDKSRMFQNISEGGHKIQVDWAAPEPFVSAERMANVTNLYVRNVSLAVSEADLARLFSLDGTLQVTRVRRPSNYAFIHFARREDAERAKNSLHGVEVDGLRLEIEWAKPLPRNDASHNENRYRSRPNKINRKGQESMHSRFCSPATAGMSSAASPSLGARGSPRPPMMQGPGPQRAFAYPPQHIFPIAPLPAPAAPGAATEGNAQLQEANDIAMELFGCRPIFKALTYPLENGQKLFYPSITLAGQTEIINILHLDRESALESAYTYCLTRLQMTRHVWNTIQMQAALRVPNGQGPAPHQAPSAGPPLILGPISPDHMPVGSPQGQRLVGMPMDIPGGAPGPQKLQTFNTLG